MVSIADEKLSLSSNEIIAVSDIDDVVSVSSHNSDVLGNSSKVATKLSVSDTSYSKSGTVFKVTLKDNSGKALNNQKISLYFTHLFRILLLHPSEVSL